VPYLGLLRTSFLFGGLNVAVGLWTLYLFKDRISQKNNLMIIGSIFFVLIVGGFIGSQRMLHFAEGLKYGAPIVYKKQSKYQRLVITQQNEGFRLFLNGNLQFDSRDEYRYHEALIHPALAALKDPRHVLVLGGGDGLAVREILKYPTIESITLVDLDPAMTKIFSTNPMLVELNEGSLKNPKVKVINDDAFIWLRQNKRVFDFIAIDFPDPSNYSLGKLYSKSFFLELRKALNPNGLFSIQSTSPYFARESYWCVASTIEEAGFKITPYHAYVPSFGEWGYFIGAFGPYLKPKSFPEGLKFLTKTSIEPLFDFPPDMKRIKVPAQKLNNQILVHLFEKEWSRVN
jgi:spermidine synthase